jgi:predicted amidohydrolase YtcJ
MKPRKFPLIVLTGIRVLMAALVVLAFPGPSSGQTVADVVLLNGKIITVDANDNIVQAVAVKDSVIIKVGSNNAIQNFIGSGTVVLNLQGKTVTPGFIDAHNHMVTAGEIETLTLSLMPPRVQYIADIQQIIAEEVLKVPDGTWIYGHGFFNLMDGRTPTRWDLDTVSPNHPVFINHISGHMAVANSKALEIAGIDSSTVDPAGGVVEKDSVTGEPTGVLMNHYAMSLVWQYLPRPTTEQYRMAIEAMVKPYQYEGISSFEDVNVGTFSKLMAYKEADSLGTLEIRGYTLYTSEYPQQVYDALDVFDPAVTEPYETAMLKFGGFKFLIDGHAGLAYCYEPTNGNRWDLPAWDADSLQKVVNMVHQAGYQMAFHCMGDKAIDMALDALEGALAVAPREDHRHRLEHCLIPTDAALLRIRQLGLVVSVQAAAMFFSGDAYRTIFGDTRVQRLMPIKTMLDMGIPVAFGSDFPTVPEFKPQLALQEAIVRKTKSGYEINLDERIDRTTALRLHTMGSAYASFDENIKGSIEEGKLADMTVWSGDYGTVLVNQIKDLEIEMLIVGGIIYQDPAVGVEHDHHLERPKSFALHQNFPNPFNSSTEIKYQVAKGVHVTLEVYNILGEKVKILVDKTRTPGHYTVQWNGRNEEGREVSSGVYWYRIITGDFVRIRQMVLQK